MALSPRDRLDRNRYKIRARPFLGEADKEVSRRILTLGRALDEKFPTVEYRDERDRVKTLKPRTIASYLSNLDRMGREFRIDLLKTSAEAINDRMREIKEERDLSGVTISGYQSALIAFYRFNDELGIDPEDIVVDSDQAEVRYDEQDLFTPEEVWALRDACNGAFAIRHRALLELLIYTGQRITALLTLKASDVDLENDSFYLNDEFADEHGGLKGALDRGRRRRLLGAKKYVRDWLEYRPDDTDWLFVGDPENPHTNNGEHWSMNAAQDALKRIANRAGVDKPVAPHAFRHYTATTLLRDWGWTEAEVKAQLGLAPTSDIFETTYSHVTAGDHIDAGADKFHGESAEEEETDTPPTCPSCGEILKPHYTECPNPSCTMVFGETEEGHLASRLGDAVSQLAREDPELAHQLIDAADMATGE